MNEKRYGAKPPETYTRPADPGMTLEEVLEMFPEEDNICGQLAREVNETRAELALLRELEAEARRFDGSTRILRYMNAVLAELDELRGKP